MGRSTNDRSGKDHSRQDQDDGIVADDAAFFEENMATRIEWERKQRRKRRDKRKNLDDGKDVFQEEEFQNDLSPSKRKRKKMSRRKRRLLEFDEESGRMIVKRRRKRQRNDDYDEWEDL